ncbi:MAG: ABC transporter ATP-binding protein [Endomicrobiaceae bacterium]|nr:ABC transporter ATP-binding protein [Endomicrobiaceae bacterium]
MFKYFDILKKINFLFGLNQKIKFVILAFGIFISSLLELIGVSLVLPLIGVVMDPSVIETNRILKYVYDFLNINSTTNFLILISFSLVGVYVLKNIYMTVLYYFQYKMIFNAQKEISTRLMTFYLKQPYSYHLTINTAEIIRTVTNDVAYCFQFLIHLFAFVSELSVVLLLISFLFFVNKAITLSLIFLFFLSFLFLFKKLKIKMSSVGRDNQFYAGLMIKWINQAFGAIKDIKTLSKERFFIDEYYKNSIKYTSAQKYFNFLQQLPRIFIETLVISVVLLMIIYFLYKGTNIASIFTQISVFAMACFRMMPSVSRIQVSMNAMIFYRPSLNVLYNDLKKTDDSETNGGDENKEINTKDGISAENISYRYPNTDKLIFENAGFEIKNGQSVAFVGKTGSGKTTLADIILGLLKPVTGTLKAGSVDIYKNKKSWSKKIGYVPQFIYLTDDTVKNNIVFYDRSNVDEKRLANAVEKSQLKEFIDSLPSGIETVVGERGIRLSGGQRQRIGIARALYNEPEFLVLDEATSSLDTDTEKAVMDAIENLYGKITMIIIAHRLTTIAKCDVIYRVENGKIIKEK